MILDAIRLAIKQLTSDMQCGSKCNTQHNMSCKNRKLVSMCHNDICELTVNILKEICNDVEIETKLIPLPGEQLQYRSAITCDEARISICAESFWVRGQELFLDIRVFDPKINRYPSTT